MIAELKGRLLHKSITDVVVDVGGVGFRVSVSLQTLASLPEVGATVELRTYLQVREDALTLFGFATQTERTAFELCIGVQGVGPKLAMSILSTLDPEDLRRAVEAGDHGRLQRIPGIGKKTAERLVLELRDKFAKAGHETTPSSPRPPAGKTQAVVSALTNLGYRPIEAERAAAQAEKEPGESSVEQLLKRALRVLAE